MLDIKIQADSVNTGSGMKDGLKAEGAKTSSNGFGDDPYITFHSDKIVQTGPGTFDLPGTFTVQGVSKPETLTFTLSDVAAAGERQGRV